MSSADSSLQAGSSHGLSPRQVQKWISFHHQGSVITLQGIVPEECAYTIAAITLNETEEVLELPEEMQMVLNGYSSIFDTPSGLPPRRQCDHVIPLIPGARPVSIRPYRVAP